MSKPCRSCGDPIDFRQDAGRWVPINADGSDHKPTCSAQRGLVPDAIKRPSRHHISQYKMKRFRECPRQSYYADVLDLPTPKTPEMEAGEVFASCVEFVAVESYKAGRLVSTVTADALFGAMEVVAARSSWTVDALSLVREIIPKAAPKIDLSDVVVDERGPYVERGFELPCGDGVIAGGVYDFVERADNAIIVNDIKSGQWRDPEPWKSPQVGLYLEHAHQLWPECEVYFRLVYVALDVPPDVIEWTPQIGEYAKGLARAVVAKARVHKDREDEWPAQFGPACSRCAFTARCPEFAARMAEDPSAYNPRTPVELAAAVHRFAPLARVIENKVKEWRESLKREAAAVVGPDGRGSIGPFPVRLVTYEVKAEEKPREGGVRTRLDIGDPTASVPPPSDAAAGALPAAPTTPAKNWLGEIAGKWPGPESEAELLAALKEQKAGALPAPVSAGNRGPDTTETGPSSAGVSPAAVSPGLSKSPGEADSSKAGVLPVTAAGAADPVNDHESAPPPAAAPTRKRKRKSEEKAGEPSLLDALPPNPSPTSW